MTRIQKADNEVTSTGVYRDFFAHMDPDVIPQTIRIPSISRGGVKPVHAADK